MKQLPSSHQIRHSPRRRGGFTLVELLVAVGLVLLIMIMFAEIFRTAGNLITRQKGMAVNNQRARNLTTVIRNDLINRTFIDVTPLTAGDTPTAEQKGYLYYSENSLESNVDDVLQFTSEVTAEEELYFGKALRVGLVTDLDQPEADDGKLFYNTVTSNLEIIENGLGASRMVEISYFVRNGNLYRRVLLIRDEYDSSATAPAGFDGDVPYVSPPPIPNSFWNDFDYSAYYLTAGLNLHNTASLDNSTAPGVSSLGRPFRRFGHDHTNGGNPREFIDPTDSATFIGRFTHQETSHIAFDYPGELADFDGDLTHTNNPTDQGEPLGLFAGVVSYEAGVDTVFSHPNDATTDDAFFDGLRRGEDILLTNVHAFDVKIWDDGLVPPQFVDVGHAIVGGDFNQVNDLHAAAPLVYGPNAANQTQNRIFDTWHPQLDVDGGGNDPPPYRPLSGVTPKRLQAIQITIRFFDVPSNQMKQLTLVHSLLN